MTPTHNPPAKQLTQRTFYIKDIFDNWNTVNFVQPKSFNNQKPAKYSPKLSDEIWIRTTSNNTEIDWIAGTGRPIRYNATAKLQVDKPIRCSPQCSPNYHMLPSIQMLQQPINPHPRSNKTQPKIGKMLSKR